MCIIDQAIYNKASKQFSNGSFVCSTKMDESGKNSLVEKMAVDRKPGGKKPGLFWKRWKKPGVFF